MNLSKFHTLGEEGRGWGVRFRGYRGAMIWEVQPWGSSGVNRHCNVILSHGGKDAETDAHLKQGMENRAFTRQWRASVRSYHVSVNVLA